MDQTPSPPISQEAFQNLWEQLHTDTTHGFMVQDPIQVTLDNYDLGEGDSGVIQQNQVELQVEHLELEPNLGNLLGNSSMPQMPSLLSMPSIPSLPSMPPTTSQSSFLEQLNETLPPHLGAPGGSVIMPSSTGYASATDATTPPPQGFTPPLGQGQDHHLRELPPPPPQQLLPTNVVYPGQYDFQINLGQPTSQAAKSISWTYSQTLQKLFVDRDKPCPIQFKTSTPPPPNCYIRVLPIFKQAENLAEVVTRCPNHVGHTGDPSANHLVVCSDPSTLYLIDDGTGRCSLRVPYTVPPVGTEFSKYLFTFKCFISCVGGLNRRKIQLVLTLENELGGVLGRQVLDVRVCACPGRDRKGEEKSYEKAKAPQKKPVKRGAKSVTTTVGLTAISSKKKKPDDEVFHIVVHGREKYEMLMKIKESLDLMELVTPQQVAQYRQQQSQVNQQYQLPNGIPNVARVSSIQSSPPSTSQGGQGGTAAPPPPPSMPRTHSFPPQPSQPRLNHQPHLQQQQLQQRQQHQQQHVHFNDQQLQPQYIPTTSTVGLHSHDRGPSKDEADGPHMEVDSIPTTQGFGSSNIQLTPPTTNNAHDPSIYGWLSRLGLKQYVNHFQCKGVHTVDQLDEIHMEDLASLPPAARETLWKSILDLRSSLQLDGTPSMLRTSSSTSTASVHSNLSASQGLASYRATRFTLKQTLSFKVEKEDDDEAGM